MRPVPRPDGSTLGHPSERSGLLDELRLSEERLHVENEELRESQVGLEHARDEYFSVFESAAIALLTLDDAGIVCHVNSAAAELLKRTRSQIQGHPFRYFLHMDDRPVWEAHCSRAHPPGAVAVCELRLDFPNEPIPVTIFTRRAPTPDRTLIHVTLLDAREREQALREKERLIEAELHARRVSDSKDQFIAMLSHELRTPLTPVLAAASALKTDATLSARLRDVFELIERNVASEARLVDDLLDITGIVRGKVQVVKEPTNVHGLLRDCLSMISPEFDRKGHQLDIRLDATLPCVHGDPLRLRQVFSNLLRNAAKFTPPAGIIRLRTWNRDEWLTADVEDTGIGFDPAVAARIFTPFDQLEEYRSQSGGLGLGLAIAKGLVELHEGQIHACSRGPGRGARFTVELRTVPTESVIHVTPSSRPPPGEIPTLVRILLVEDHLDTAEMMSDLLRIEGFEVVHSDCIQSALTVDMNAVDLIVSDLALPDGTGLELLPQLRDRHAVPAIALSGFGMQSDIQSSKQAGFNQHLTKPVDFEKLLGAIRQLTRVANES